MSPAIPTHLLRWIAAIWLCAISGYIQAEPKTSVEAVPSAHETIDQLGKNLKVGDVVFIHVSPLPFEKVSAVTRSWVNHVGIVADVSGKEPVIAESTFPFSRATTLSRFTERSKQGRVAVARLDKPLTEQQSREIRRASSKRLGIFYDTGFNLNSGRQFCSRFVREVLAEATGVTVGDIETFKTLLDGNPDTDIAFWRAWYLGNIPWERQTVTPASLIRSAHLSMVFDGFIS